MCWDLCRVPSGHLCSHRADRAPSPLSACTQGSSQGNVPKNESEIRLPGHHGIHHQVGPAALSHAGRGMPAFTQLAQHLKEQICFAGITFSPRKSHTHLPTLVFSQQSSGFKRNSQATWFFHCFLSLELAPTKYPSTIQSKLCTSFS